MRALASVALLIVAAAGCAGPKNSGSTMAPSAATNAPALVTPSGALVGKVVTVNVAGRFAILNFPVGRLPAMGQRLNVYRAGLKVGEVRVTGPQADDNVAGDVTIGGAQAGDTVKDQ